MIGDGSLPVPALRRRGRAAALPTAERRRRLIDAAEAVFESRGYAAASVDDIAKAAGMSKATIYRGFETKQMLLRALVEQRSLDLLPSWPSIGAASREMFERFLGRLARAALSPRFIGLLRLVIAEAPHMPEVAVPLRRRIAEAHGCIGAWVAAHPGLLRVADDPDRVAGRIYGAIVAERQLALLTGRIDEHSGAAIDDRIRAVLDMHLA